MLSAYERRRFQREVINEMPLYPTEGLLWDEHQIPSVNYTGEGCLALPKLNLQFLTPHDYLLRNFNLFRWVLLCVRAYLTNSRALFICR